MEHRHEMGIQRGHEMGIKWGHEAGAARAQGMGQGHAEKGMVKQAHRATAWAWSGGMGMEQDWGVGAWAWSRGRGISTENTWHTTRAAWEGYYLGLWFLHALLHSFPSTV